MLNIYKTISILVIMLAATTHSWPASNFCLRPQAAFDRDTLDGKSGFTFADLQVICPGVSKTDVVFQKEGRFAKGWIIEIQPRLVECDMWVEPAMVGYNLHTSASTKELAEKFGRMHVPLPGKTIPGFRDSLSQIDRKRVVLIGPATQGGFWGANTIVVKDGQLIKKTAPGLYQAEVMEPNGDFYFLVMDPGKAGVRKITLIDGVPQEDISDIKLAFVGPPLFYHGEDLSGRIRFPKTADGQPAQLESGYDVNWDAQKTITSFIIWGCNRKTGTIHYFPMIRTGDKPIDGVLCTEMIEAFTQYAGVKGIDMNDVDLILGPGSVDVNVILKDEELFSTVDPRSATAKDYPDGRPLGTIVYGLRKDPDDIGIDGGRYERAVVSQSNRADSDKWLEDLRSALETRVAERYKRKVRGEEVVFEARWLLDQLIKRSNCSDKLFKKNMPPHMSVMEELIKELDQDASPELLIAGMFHDSDRFFDGYYVMMKDEPAVKSQQYINYYKPIQHPRMAAEFIRPLLELLGIDRDVIEKIDTLIRNHETGIVDKMAPAKLVSDSRLLMDADGISMFTPVLLSNILQDQGFDQFTNAVRQKYKRSSLKARIAINKLIDNNRGKYEAASYWGGSAWWVVIRERYRVFMEEESKRPEIFAGAI